MANSKCMNQLHIFKLYSAPHGQHSTLHVEKMRLVLGAKLFGGEHKDRLKVEMEYCFRILLKSEENDSKIDIFWAENSEKLNWLFAGSPFENATLTLDSKLKAATNCANEFIFEIGPRPTMTTPFSTNVVAVLRHAGIPRVERVEKSRRYRFYVNEHNAKASNLFCELFDNLTTTNNSNFSLLNVCGDRMTECVYDENTDLNICATKISRDDCQNKFNVIDILDPTNGVKNLRDADAQLALGFDESDFEFYLNFFRNKIGRNPTDVELFDLAQSNSEHSRHWFFKGDIAVDGVKRTQSLFVNIQKTQNFSNPNNVIAFSDNSSAIKGFATKNLVSQRPDAHSELVTKTSPRHIVYTAETHNFPTGVCPFPGAATGVGGRIRDIHATGRGAHEIGGIAGYSVGNLNLPGYAQPWEHTEWAYPTVAFASPSKILLEASDGASDYGNKFGEPLICGFTRTFGMRIPTTEGKTERIEYVKPIMFSGGIGAIDDVFLYKDKCSRGQIVAKIGGPVYRIGVGGGAASSCAVQGARDNSIDFGAVQRGDPEMEQKLHRIIRSCIELGESNPILSIHDQGAGGNGNVLKEIVEGNGGGALICAGAFELGDSSITLRELWGAEYQESDAVLLDPSLMDMVERIARRERCTVSAVGRVTGDQRILLANFENGNDINKCTENINLNNVQPVNLDLRLIGERDPKKFDLLSLPLPQISSFVLPQALTVADTLERVLRLPSVASKRFLTSKVDRSVSGLVAQQQCVGVLQTPLADVAVTALSYWNQVGSAVACGEQPLKGIVDAAVGARMAVGEALTNLDVKCSGNWMFAARLPGEGARLVRACDAMCAVMRELGVAVDGGKDSLSMAAQVENASNVAIAKDSATAAEVVKAPGTLVISAYVPCLDILRVVTPDFKPNKDQSTAILHLQMGQNFKYNQLSQTRMGGSALAQCFQQVGGQSAPDLDDAAHFVRCFCLVQTWIESEKIISGHDISDGGILGALLESAFAGNCAFECAFDAPHSGENGDTLTALKMLFSEELGVILEVNALFVDELLADAKRVSVNSITQIGQTYPIFGSNATAKVSVNNMIVLSAKIVELREIWEATSDRMEALQLPQKCIVQQAEWRKNCDVPRVAYEANFEYGSLLKLADIERPIRESPRVAILREEGSNGDREMAAAFAMSGFAVFDVTMTDLIESANSNSADILSAFSGLALVGGFSYADVLGSARGWAASILYNVKLKRQFDAFRKRADTFSLGVCNGCQLMSLLGFIGMNSTKENVRVENSDVFLDENESGRFYSGFNAVRVEENSPSIFLRDMQKSILGVWCSHGEGRFTYRNPTVLEQLNSKNLVCIRYCDESGKTALQYPSNPNGSVEGVAAISSSDGRHLAMMPHPDRSFLQWQCPNRSVSKRNSNFCPNSPPFSPWIRLFQNAFAWSVENCGKETE